MGNFKIALIWVVILGFFFLLFNQGHVIRNEPGQILLLPVGLIMAGAYLIYRWIRSTPAPRKPKPSGFVNFNTSNNKAENDMQAHADLVRMCLGDVAKVERLIQFELRKQPAYSRAQATRAARDRLQYDKQR